MILCIGTTPAEQRVMLFPSLTFNAVNRAATTLDGVAGKSVNVAKVLKALGQQAVATGFLGGERGRRLSAVLTERDITHDFVTIEAATRQCITVIDESAGTQTELVQESRAVPADAYSTLIKVIRRRVRKCRAVIMSGTLTPGGPVTFYADCAAISAEAGAISIVDARGPALVEALEAKPGLVKPNRAELADTIGRPLQSRKAAMSAMRELCERGAQRVVVTAGEKPALAYDGRSFWRIVPPHIRAVNPIGSGDAFTAALAWRLLRGDDLGEACRWAAAAGAANALTLMPGEVALPDVVRLARRITSEWLAA